MSGTGGNGAIRLRRKPSLETERALRRAAESAVLKDKLSYRDAQALFRALLIDTALVTCKGVKVNAGAMLGLGRDHVRNYSVRARGILR